MGEQLRSLDRRTMLLGLLQHHWEALERCRMTEEEFFEKRLPLQGLVHTRTEIAAELHKIMLELRKNEELEWLRQIAMGSKGFSLPPLSDSAKQALELILPQFSPCHCMLLRQILDRG